MGSIFTTGGAPVRGGSPFTYTYSPTGAPTETFNVSGAYAIADNKVRVGYDAEAYHISASNENDALNPANYEFTSDTGVNRSGSSVSLYQEDPTIVDVTLDGEMTDAATYTVAVSGVLRAEDDEALTTDSAQFTGSGTDPQVSTASAQASGTIRVTFSEAMDDNAALTSTSTYTISGATSLTKYSVETVTASSVDITVSEMKDGGAYTVTVSGSGVVDLADNPLDAEHNSAQFNGIGIHPRVSTASAQTSGKVRIIFDEEMENNADLTSTDSYAVTGTTTLGVSSVSRINGTTVDLITSEMLDGGSYTVVVSDVVDLADNVIDPAYNSYVFEGIGRNPHVSSATAQNGTTVRVVFDEVMKNNWELVSTNSYSITGDTSITIYDVDRIDGYTVDVTTNEMLQGGAYTLTVTSSGVEDLVGNYIDPSYNYANFNGVGTLPQVSSATAQSSGVVRLFYDSLMEENAALISTDSYTITGDTSLTKYSVETVTASSVDVHVSEMKDGGTYTITVSGSGIVDTSGNPVDPLHDSAQFTGIGYYPQVSTASAQASGTVRVVFNEEMNDDATLVDTSSYAVTGTTTLGVSSISRIDGTTVDLYTSEMYDGGSYTVVVSNVTDLADNVIDPAHNSYSFTGIGRRPRISTASAQSSGQVQLIFDEPMKDDYALTSTSSYAITGTTTLAISGVARITPTMLSLYTSEMRDGGSYTIVASNVRDLGNNLIDPDYNNYSFTGEGGRPKVIGAQGISETEVRLVFDEDMENNAALVSTESYSISGATAVVPSGVVREDGTHILITTSPLQELGAYTITVTSSGVVDLVGNSLDPSYTSANFTGPSENPKVSSAAAQDSITVRAVFSEEMANNADLISTDSYSITGDTVLTKDSVTRINGTTIDVAVSEMLDGGSYTFTVLSSGVQDLSGNPVDPSYNSYGFTGIGIHPQVSTATALSSASVRVTFNEAMEDNAALVAIDSYTIDGASIPDINSVTRVNGTTIDIYTDEMVDGGAYTFTVVSSGVVDVAGNDIDPAHDSAEFTGIGVTPRVTNAEAVSSATVLVSFSETMDDAKPEFSSTDSYSITGDTSITINHVGYGRSPVSAIALATNEMLDGGSYTFTVLSSGVQDTAGNPVNPSYDSYDFTGIGIHPQLSTASCPTTGVVRLVFNEPMTENAALVSTDSYTISGATEVTKYSVATVTASSVDITVSELLDGGSYTAVVTASGAITGVVDLAGNYIDPAYNSYTFTGVGTDPRVSVATSSATGITGTVNVTFNEPMADNEPLVNTLNYSVTGDTVITIADAVRVDAYTVGLTTNEMLDGGNYTVTVATSGVTGVNAITDLVGNPVDPAYNYYNFTGVGVHPQVSSAVATDSTTVRLVFDEDMENNSYLTDTSSYAVTGDTSISISSVTRIDATTIDLTVSELQQGGNYTAVVASDYVVDLAGNSVDPEYNSYEFTGIGIGPQVIDAHATSSTQVSVEYSEAMDRNDAYTDTASYSITGDTKIIISGIAANRHLPIILLTTNEMLDGGSYTFTVVSSGVQDVAENPVDPAHNSYDFTGIGIHPQLTTATAESSGTVRLVFNEAMSNNAALVSTDSYVISGATPITNLGVTRIDATTVDISVSEMLDGASYTAVVTASGEITGVVDLAGNYVDPSYNSYVFSGIGDLPRVTSASASALGTTGTVRVVFSEAMENNAALVDTVNYAVTGDTSVSVSAVTRIDEYTVDLTTNEMKNGGSYTATVATSGITDLIGNTVDPSNNYADFSGAGIQPQVSTASAISSGAVQIVFSEPMTNNADLTSTLNYTISGASTPSIHSISYIDSTTVRTSNTELVSGGLYTVVVENVVDLADNVIDPYHNYAYFTGIGVLPEVIDPATIVDYFSVYVDYNEQVQPGDATDPANYSVVPTLGTISASQISGSRYKLTFSNEHLKGTGYTITVSNVRDLAGNPIDPLHNYATFTGTTPIILWHAEILIGDTVIWSSIIDNVEEPISLDVSNYTGTQTIKFRIRAEETS